MIHSTPRKQPPNIDLDHTFEHFAECRYYIGDFFEEATKAHFGAVRLATIGNVDICPDHQLNETTFFECKSVGRNGSSILYDTQVAKHTEFVSGGFQFYYVFWLHNFEVSGTGTVGELHRGLARSLRKVIVVPISTIISTVSTLPKRILNYRGRVDLDGLWHREKASWGWQVRPNKLPKAPPAECRSIQVYGTTIQPFIIHQPFELDDLLRDIAYAPF